MYDFIFIFFYNIGFRSNPDAVGGAKTFVALTTFLHIFLVINILDYAFDLELFLNKDTEYEKYYFIPIPIVWYLVIYLIYNKKKIHYLIERSKTKGNKNTLRDNVYMVLILIAPTIIAIYLNMMNQS